MSSRNSKKQLLNPIQVTTSVNEGSVHYGMFLSWFFLALRIAGSYEAKYQRSATSGHSGL